MTKVCGLILAGGRSGRFGREKALAELGGRPLIDWVTHALQPGAAAVAVNAREGSGAADFARSRDLACIHDGAGGTPGPLAGVRSGLAWAASLGADWLATAPCDTPFLPTDLVARLLAGRQEGGAVAATADGLHPACALWPVGDREVIDSIEGHPPLRRILERLGASIVPFDDAAAFVNLNTAEDLDLAETRLRAPESATPASDAR